MATTRQLFPTIPPELRNEIYTHTISPDNPASNTALPFTSKQYDICGTTVHIYPVQHGNNALLALTNHNFLEASEYKAYLLAHGIVLRIAIVIKVAPHIFTPRHWDDKLRTHLRKLLARYPYLGTVQRVEVKMFWEPKGGCWADAAQDHKVSGILNGMVASLLGNLPSHRGKGKRELNVALHLEPWAQWRLKDHLPAFVHGRVLAPDGVEKRMVVFERKGEDPVVMGRLLKRKLVVKEKDIVVFDGEKGTVSWGEKCEGIVGMSSLAF